MHLSRLTLRPDASRSPSFWQRLGDAYSLHKEVWRLFADDPDKDRDFLYRIDLHRGRPRLYTLSPGEPRDPGRLWKIETKPFRPRLRQGDRLGFVLRANPTVKRNGSRHDVVMDAKHRLREESTDPGRPQERPTTQAELVAEHGAGWLERKAEALGVGFVAIHADGYHVHRFEKPASNGRRRRQVTVATCDFQGALEIKDPERFAQAVTAGIGPAKGFGCGLALLRRLP